jgi:hypothetical protein
MYEYAQGKEYGIVETTFATTGVSGYSESKHFIPICTERDVTNFNYSVTGVDNVDNLGVDVHFVPSIDEFIKCVESPTVNPNTYCTEGTFFDAYPGCSHEDMLTVTGTCNGVEQGSGLLISSSGMSTGHLSYIHVKLQENFDGMQTLSNVATTQEAPILPTSVQATKLTLLEQEMDVDREIALLDSENFLTITDTTLSQNSDEFTIVGWIRPDFSEGSQESTIVSKQNSFKMFFTNPSFQQQEGHTVIIPNHTMNLSLYDGVKWFTIYGDTEVTEDWYYVAAVVDGSKATLYLDGEVEGELKLQQKIVSGTCSEKECFTDTKMSV